MLIKELDGWLNEYDLKPERGSLSWAIWIIHFTAEWIASSSFFIVFKLFDHNGLEKGFLTSAILLGESSKFFSWTNTFTNNWCNLIKAITGLVIYKHSFPVASDCYGILPFCKPLGYFTYTEVISALPAMSGAHICYYILWEACCMMSVV